jgi:DNA-damage-inducible protein D
MTKKLAINALNKDFESIKKIDNRGEYWTARELMPLLGYERWENAEETIKRAQQACVNSGQNTEDHFRKATKMINIASGTARETVRMVKEYHLSRYACYLIAQNGDPKKPAIAQAQTYFAIQTRKQEIFEKLSGTEKRLFIRGEVSDHNKKLFKTAKNAGVTKFGLFNDAGYRGLYGAPLADIEKKKGVQKGELLDRAGTTELAANLFRITQTDAKIKKENIKGDHSASQTHFMIGGKVRQTIKDIGGTLPENLPTEKHIKELKKEQKKLISDGKKRN